MYSAPKTEQITLGSDKLMWALSPSPSHPEAHAPARGGADIGSLGPSY